MDVVLLGINRTNFIILIFGGVAEWLKAPVLKIGSEKHSRVRISTPPRDCINYDVQQVFYKLINILE